MPKVRSSQLLLGDMTPDDGALFHEAHVLAARQAGVDQRRRGFRRMVQGVWQHSYVVVCVGRPPCTKCARYLDLMYQWGWDSWGRGSAAQYS